jgi:hypothetical protein
MLSRPIARLMRIALAAVVPLALSACGGSSSAPSFTSASALMPPSAVARTSSISHQVTFSQTHVLTWDALDYGNGITPVSASAAAPWLTWVMTDSAHSAMFHGAGIKTMYYTQPNRQAPGGAEWSSDETTFAHDCNNDRIATTNYAGHYLMNPDSSHLRQLWQQEVTDVLKNWGGQFDAVYEDLTDTTVYTSASPCGFNQNDWSGFSNAMSTYITGQGVQLFYNGLAAVVKDDGTDSISPTIAMNSSTSGGMFEGCYTTSGDFPRLHAALWVTTENTEIAMAAARKIFLCRALDNANAADAIGDRIYQYASFLLTYHRYTSVLGEGFNTHDLFSELPEEELVPTEALQTYPSDVSQLVQTGGAYGRQWSACYVAGVAVGPCAVAINESTTSSVPFPWPTEYHHTIALAGQDILGGGTIRTDGPAPAAQIPALSAVIAFQ